MKMGRQHHVPAGVRPERPGTHSGGWLGLMIGLDGCERSFLHQDSIPGPSSPKRVAIPTTLSGPTFHKSSPTISIAETVLVMHVGIHILFSCKRISQWTTSPYCNEHSDTATSTAEGNVQVGYRSSRNSANLLRWRVTSKALERDTKWPVKYAPEVWPVHP